jgi:hypothetical protein
LVAQNPAFAERLYQAATAHVPKGETIFVDIPKANVAAQSLPATFGLEAVFETARMYTGPDPAIELSKLFGVTTFELG